MDFTNTNPMEQGVVIEQPELNTGLDDFSLNSILDARISESKTVYEHLKLEDRRKRNRDYWLGNQVKDPDGLPYIDNVIWQNTEHRISIAVGRMPDMLITPGDRSLQSREKAQVLERVLDIDFSTKEKKRLMKNGLRHNHLYMIGILKGCWNPNKGMFGDYEFNLRDPRKVLISHTGSIPEDGFTADNCDLIVDIVEEPVAVVLAKFPGKRNELMQMMHSNDPSRLATTIKYQEIWYTYHDKTGQIIEGVCWRYNHLILRNIKNPYFDFTGYQRPIYGQDGRPVYNQFGQVQTQQVFRNFFDRPRKPYMFFSYQNLGDTPIDSTTAVEQSIPLQQNLNKTGKQIRDITDGVTNKYAANNGISQDKFRDVTSDPKQGIWVDSDKDVREIITSFRNDGPPVSLFNDMAQTRQQIDAKFNTHATTRGETKAAESGISKQISREGDLVTSDDIVEIVLERVLEEAGSWAIQFMKLMYVDPHFKSKMGKDGQLIQEWIQRDMIDDGMALSVRGSTTDKIRAQSLAVQRAEAGIIDPLTMLEDLDVPNPKEQALRTILFKMGEGEGGDAFARYMQFAGLEDPSVSKQAPIPGQEAQQLPPAVPPEVIAPEQQAPQPDIAQLLQMMG